MSNPLYQSLNGKNNNNFMDMLAKFQQFKNTFTGDPKQQVMSLLSSGKMTNEQFNQLQTMAQAFQSLMK